MTDEMLAALQEWYSSDDIIELTALVSFQNLSAKFNTALDVPAQGFCSLPITPNDIAQDNVQASDKNITKKDQANE